jgi:AcrR family transcriptional regulator
MVPRARYISLLPAAPRKRKKAALQPKKAPQQPRARITYESILDASALILETFGYPALTTNGVAAVAGVAVGGVYAYFPNKEAIAAELIRREVDRSIDEIGAVFAAAASVEDRDQALTQLVRGCAQVLARRRTLLKVFLEQVPFLSELDTIKTVPARLFEIAWRSRAIANATIAEGDLRARAYLFLLIPIGRWVPYAAIIDRPDWLSEQQAEDAMVAIFRRLLT